MEGVMSGELTEERLAELEALAGAVVGDITLCKMQAAVWPETLLALVAAARELRRIRNAPWYAFPAAKHAVDVARAERDLLEKERDELRAKVTHLESVIDDKHSATVLGQADCYRKGREDERADVVAWLVGNFESYGSLSQEERDAVDVTAAAAEAIERGEHVRGGGK